MKYLDYLIWIAAALLAVCLTLEQRRNKALLKEIEELKKPKFCRGWLKCDQTKMVTMWDEEGETVAYFYDNFDDVGKKYPKPDTILVHK